MALENSPTKNQPGFEPLRFLIGNGMRNASDNLLEEAVELWEAFELAFAGVVVAGVIFEFFIAYLHPAYDTPRGVWGPVIGDALVAIGLVVEVAAGMRAKALQSELTRRSNDRLAEATERAAKAEAETERLRAITSWRRVSVIQAKTLTPLLATLPVESVALWHVAGDSESRVYAQDIGAVLKHLGWQVAYIAGTFPDAPIFGVHIRGKNGNDGADLLAMAIHNAFKLASIKTFLGIIPFPFPITEVKSGDTHRFPTICVYVGPKPPVEA
jgi:hypothetical protein